MSRSGDTRTFRLGSNQIDLDLMRVRTPSEEWMLSVRESRILEILFQAQGQTVDSDTIYRHAWSSRGATQGRPLTFAIRRLRQKLERDPKNPEFIVTVRGLGFRLEGAIVQSPAQTHVLDRSSLLEQQPLDAFVGRATERDELLGLLTGPCRLLSICGAGGVGKSRLLVQVLLDHLEAFDECPIAWVDLADVGDGVAMLFEVARSIGFTGEEAKDWTSSLRDLSVGLSQLGDLIVVLDNADHCLNSVHTMIQTLMLESKQVRVVLTAREPLDRMECKVLRVRGLSTDEARELFLCRAYPGKVDAAVDSESEKYLLQVVEQLRESPLAIELAASRASTLSLKAMANRLERQLDILSRKRQDVHPRQQTLRATLQWSWDLLDDAERELLMLCSVFSGAFDALEVEFVLGEADALEALMGLADLVEKSLILREESTGTPRFMMSQSMRQFMAEKARRSPQWSEHYHQVRRMHLQAYGTSSYVQSVVQLGVLISVEQVRWLTQHLDNLIGALQAALAEKEVELAIVVLRAVVQLCRHVGHLPVALEQVERALGQLETGTEGWAWTLILKIELQLDVRDFAGARECIQALTGNEEFSAMCRGRLLLLQARIHMHLGDLNVAQSLIAEIETDSAAERGLLALTHLLSVQVQFTKRDLVAAKEALSSATTVFRELGATCHDASIMMWHTSIAGVEGDFHKAHRRALEALRLAKQSQNAKIERRVLKELALIEMKRGDIEDSFKTHQLAVEACITQGATQSLTNVYNNQAALMRVMGEDEQAIALFRKAIQLAQATQQPWIETMLIGNLGSVFLELGDAVQGAALLEKAIEVGERIGDTWTHLVFKLMLGLCWRKMGREEDGQAQWARFQPLVREKTTADQFAQLLMVRILVEHALGQNEQVDQLCTEVDAILSGIPGGPSYEANWYRQRLERMRNSSTI